MTSPILKFVGTLLELNSFNCVAVIMKKYLLAVVFILVLPVNLHAQNSMAAKASPHEQTKVLTTTVESPPQRVAMLELYTSEGCSSCPPADQFLSDLKVAGISDRQIIPMAFHVTYWDYIGWQDRFASKRFDDRQRSLAGKNKMNTVYTPQFIFSGDDYRRYARFHEDINKLVSQKSTVDLQLTASRQVGSIQLGLKPNLSKSETATVVFYIAVTENNLFSEVSDGENAGSRLQHDYVVRELFGPYIFAEDNQPEIQQTIVMQPDWKPQDLSIVAFAENSRSGEILQAVRLHY